MRRLAYAAYAAAALCGLLGAAGCGDSEKGQPPPWASSAAPPPKALPAAGAASATATPAPLGDEQIRAAVLSKLKDRKWTNEDFIESESNRDPFHPYLVDIGQGEMPTPQYEILMSKYSLDEVKLQAIVGPPTDQKGGRAIAHDSHLQTRAMFVDPSGIGHSVVRGNHISKADAQVFRIDGEKYQVIVKLREELGNGKSREVERVIELYQGVTGNP